MKRAKRNHKAYKQGYNQGIKGHSQELCPFVNNMDKRAEWLSGFRRGHEDHVAGFRSEAE